MSYQWNKNTCAMDGTCYVTHTSLENATENTVGVQQRDMFLSVSCLPRSSKSYATCSGRVLRRGRLRSRPYTRAIIIPKTRENEHPEACRDGGIATARTTNARTAPLEHTLPAHLPSARTSSQILPPSQQRCVHFWITGKVSSLVYDSVLLLNKVSARRHRTSPPHRGTVT